MELVSVLALDESARVALVDSYSNVHWAMFKDAQGQIAHVCIDRRDGSATKNRLFDKARHPDKPGATLLELGSEEEGIAISLLSRWFDSDEPRKMGIGDLGLEIVRDAFLRLGETIGDAPAESTR